MPWYDFESNLGSYRWKSFYAQYNHIDVKDDRFKLSMLYGLEDELVAESKNLVEELRESFGVWISSIELDDCLPKIAFSPSDRFLNFNYTSTLQSVYGIPASQILHIDGNAENYDELVFGHGIEIPEQPQYDEEGNSLWTPFSDGEGAAMSPLYLFKKPVSDIILKNADYFSSLIGITEIVVIGHSLNNIDLPYFAKVNECCPSAQWYVTCYDEGDLVIFQQQLAKCGVAPERVQISLLCDSGHFLAFRN